MSFLRILLLGLVGGVIVHIVAILLVPRVAGADLIAAFESLGPEGRFVTLEQSSGGGTAAPFLDPDFVYALCRVNLTAGPARIAATLTAELWSVAVYDRQGTNLFSVNDQTAGRSAIDLVVLRGEDLTALQRRGAAILEQAILVDVPFADALVVIRAFYRDPTLLQATRAMLAAADCRAPLEPPAVPAPAAAEAAPPL
jgi:uncharacterized membrane protein